MFNYTIILLKLVLKFSKSEYKNTLSFVIKKCELKLKYFYSSQPEYASVGYMAKRIQMRKNRFLALQKMAEQKKSEMVAAQAAMNANNASMNDVGPQDMHGMPKQTVRFVNSTLRLRKFSGLIGRIESLLQQ